MSKATATTSVVDELSALRFAFEELLRIRNCLAVKRDQTRRFRAADRRIRRAHQAVQKQLQELAVQLHFRGVSPIEIKELIDNAARETTAS